jgi:hypothetical protein
LYPANLYLSAASLFFSHDEDGLDGVDRLDGLDAELSVDGLETELSLVSVDGLDAELSVDGLEAELSLVSVDGLEAELSLVSVDGLDAELSVDGLEAELSLVSVDGLDWLDGLDGLEVLSDDRLDELPEEDDDRSYPSYAWMTPSSNVRMTAAMPSAIFVSQPTTTSSPQGLRGPLVSRQPSTASPCASCCVAPLAITRRPTSSRTHCQSAS